MTMSINTAVLHVLDFQQKIFTLSDVSLNLEDEVIRKYVEKLVKKTEGEVNSRKGNFEEDSRFLKRIKEYQTDQNFLAFTQSAASDIQEELKDAAVEPLDVLFALFDEDEVPWIALLLVENQSAYAQVTQMEEDQIANSIAYGTHILPSPGQKVRTFALINMLTLEISYQDELKWNVSDLNVMRDMILQCSAGPSHKEVLDSITDITDDIAEEYHENPTVLLTKVKQYMHEAAEEDTPIEKADLAVHVFNESEEMQDSFLSKSMEADLPAQLTVPKKIISREMKRQQIKTDTGISLSFPVEYAQDPSKIEFIDHEDGTVTIELHHIGHITNRK